MTLMRRFLLFFAIVVAVPVVCQATIQQQRDQISVSIIIDVTPAPLAFQGHVTHDGAGIVARLTLDRAAKPFGTLRAENLAYLSSNAVAQNQGSLKVEAEVSPNPNATLLYSDIPGVEYTQTGGTTVEHTCAYTVTVHTSTSYTLDHGLFTDFAQSGGGASFAGGNVANNTYVSVPQATATPFVVYSDDGHVWAKAATGAAVTTYCVDLTITVPSTTAQGTYSSNAVYTLFY